MSNLRDEFDRAIEEGWDAFFDEAEANFGLPDFLLWGVASRETNMGGRELGPHRFQWLEQKGDQGHGHGLTQIDDRSFPRWCAAKDPKSGIPLWQLPRNCIMMGGEVMEGKRKVTAYFLDTKKRFTYKNKVYTIDVKPTSEERLRIYVAAYNCGEGGALAGWKMGDIDKFTAHGSYSEDVLERAVTFKSLMEEYRAKTA